MSCTKVLDHRRTPCLARRRLAHELVRFVEGVADELAFDGVDQTDSGPDARRSQRTDTQVRSLLAERGGTDHAAHSARPCHRCGVPATAGAACAV
jgi:hypothetical protein